jgi:hypothetical protein
MQRTIFDYIDVKRLPKCLCVIPFYGGSSDAVHASRVTNPIYYLKTLFSMKRYFDRIVSFVNNERDKKFLENLPGSSEVIQIECNPIHLPVSAMGHIQTHGDDFPFESIFYTEADQILYCTDLPGVLDKCDDTTYVVPHRFVKLPIADRPMFTTKKYDLESPIVMFDGRPFEIRHYVGRDNPEKERFYQVKNKWRAFGGTWIAKRNLFMKTKFKFVDYQPIEEACFSMFTDDRKMYRTYDPYDLFVDHLSGFEQIARDCGMDILTLPGGW